MRRTRASRQRGLSLLELLVALVIMGFSLGMLYQATGGAVRNVEDTELHQRAALLAQGVLNSRDSVPEAGWTESGRSGSFSWQVSSAAFATTVTNTNVPALQQVRIVVDWTDRRGPHQVELQTLMPQARPAAGAVR
jgi:general secretion pathway protein I